MTRRSPIVWGSSCWSVIDTQMTACRKCQSFFSFHMAPQSSVSNTRPKKLWRKVQDWPSKSRNISWRLWKSLILILNVKLLTRTLWLTTTIWKLIQRRKNKLQVQSMVCFLVKGNILYLTRVDKSLWSNFWKCSLTDFLWFVVPVETWNLKILSPVQWLREPGEKSRNVTTVCQIIWLFISSNKILL